MKARELLAEKLHSVYCPNDGNCSYTDKDLMAVDVILAELPTPKEKPVKCDFCDDTGIRFMGIDHNRQKCFAPCQCSDEESNALKSE